MTINKAQGQIIPTVGIYLPERVFSHGQLYVALSRATAAKNIKVLTAEQEEAEEEEEQKKKQHKQNINEE
jgi:ATP-dependent DNA helicase PIF1